MLNRFKTYQQQSTELGHLNRLRLKGKPYPENKTAAYHLSLQKTVDNYRSSMHYKFTIKIINFYNNIKYNSKIRTVMRKLALLP